MTFPLITPMSNVLVADMLTYKLAFRSLVRRLHGPEMDFFRTGFKQNRDKT